MPTGIEFTLSNGLVTVIDQTDLQKVSRWHWHARNCRSSFYVARTTSLHAEGVRTVKNIYMHRFLMAAPADMQVDHLNGDTLDNRRANLEIVTKDENLARRLHGRKI